MCMPIAIVSATVGSLSQFGPSSPVNLKISLLTTPHSGLNMKRTDRMVGIDGTAQGRMNSTDSHLIQGRDCGEEAGQEQRDQHLEIDADDQEDQRVDRGAREDRVVIERDIARRMARQPQAVADRVDHEGQEHEQIGRQQHDAPDLRRASAAPTAAGRACGCGERDRHAVTLVRRRPCEGRDP